MKATWEHIDCIEKLTAALVELVKFQGSETSGKSADKLTKEEAEAYFDMMGRATEALEAAEKIGIDIKGMIRGKFNHGRKRPSI